MVPPWIPVRIVSKTLAAEDIYIFELADPESRNLPAFSAGSHIDVEVRPGLVRQYSLCNNPTENGRYQIAVLLDPASRGGSSGLHDDWSAGALINISAPRNHFGLEPSARQSILLAGGIGVTPLLCMAERLSHIGADFELHYCTRSQARTAFLDRIANCALSEHTRFHFDEGPNNQRLDPKAVLGASRPDTHVYVCGPPGFIDWIFAAAETAGWPEDQLHREYFTAPETTKSQTGDTAFDVRIASTGQTITIPADQSVAATLAAHGIEITVSCEQGVCGTCITGVLEGEPDHRDMILTDADLDQFTPCCSRSYSPLLVLDL